MGGEVSSTEIIDVYIDDLPGRHQRIRGHQPIPIGPPERRSRTPLIEPPVIERSSRWPLTELDGGQVLDLLTEISAGAPVKEQARRRAGHVALLGWLATFPGGTWQQRWWNSGANTAEARWTDLVQVASLAGGHVRATLTGAASRLIVAEVIRPSYAWLYKNPSGTLVSAFRARHDPDGFAEIEVLCDRTQRLTKLDRSFALTQLTRILIHNGGRVADITLNDCIDAYRAQNTCSTRQHSFWYQLLIQAGILGTNPPPSIWAASRRGQLTVEELVDGYHVEHVPVRDVLVDYLHERQAGLDYTSLRQLAMKLARLFWRDLELHEPGIDSLALSDRAARDWKQRLRTVNVGYHNVGKLREDPNSILMAVRAFYTDINHWAQQHPERWARWAAPNPITGRDLLGQNKQKHRATARMQQRTRELTPMLPALVAAAEQQRAHAAAALTAALAKPGEHTFEVDGEHLTRLSLATDPQRGGAGRPGVTYAVTVGDTKRRNLTLEEDNAFWSWALIEVFRHTGARIEEVLELTHANFSAYRLQATGEIIPMLQINPSKTDRERLLVISPELAEVLAEIIKRVSAGHPILPLVTRYDHYERRHSPPLPYLFQRPWGLTNHTFTHGRVGHLLDRTLTASGLTGHDGQPLHVTPHDFRRIFATEAVAAGLPVHIAAKLLGHQTLNTTQGYIAIYERDVIEHHRAFIERRRALRPTEEYRDVTDDEWDDFIGHFEKRKVELGTCARPYATPCVHEHACIRCPMLRPDPAQQHRLIEIIENLHDRLGEAHQQGWHGEIDGLEISIAGANHKLQAMQRVRAPRTPTPGTPNEQE